MWQTLVIMESKWWGYGGFIILSPFLETFDSYKFFH